MQTIIHEIFHILAFSPMLFKGLNGKGLVEVMHPVTNEKSFAIASTKVIEMARKHFGCSTLEHLYLENEGGSGTASSHWEKQFLGNELITGFISGNPVLSNISLALLEDSGWYKVNYDTA